VRPRSRWLIRRSVGAEGTAQDDVVPSSGVTQTADIRGPAHIVGSGSQYNVNLTLSDDSITRLLPDLERLLAGLSDALAVIYEVAGAAELPVELDVRGLLNWLAELMIPADQIPRPLWVSELAGRRATDPDARQAFSAIGERWAAEVPGGQHRLSEFRKSSESSDGPTDEPCLLVILEPDRNGGDRYRLSSILFRNRRDREPHQWDDTCLSLDEIRSRLQESLPALVQTVDRGSLFVEFVVPRELLNTDFDQWLIPERHGALSSQHYQLGVRYPVVVRDLERMIPSDDRSMWQARWQRLCNCSGSVSGAVRWVDPQDRDSYGSLAASLLRERAHGQVCLALLPERSPGTPIAELLGAGLTAGVPAAIWLRQPSTGRSGGKKDRKYLAEAVEAAELRRLPRRVLDLRQQAEEAQKAATHQGRHLSLLWDDPSRIWEPPPFTEPLLSSNGADE
jgi:NTP-dependent ternary conflict system VMAP-like protein